MNVDPNNAAGGGTPAPAAIPPASAVPPTPAAAATPPAGTTPPSDPAGVTPPAGDAPKPTLAGEKPPAAADAPAAFDPAKLQLPEGMKTDDPLFSEFSGLMTDDKLSPQDRGQKMMDLYTKAVKASADASRAAWDTVNQQWVTAVKADPDIGGVKFEATKASIAKAIDSLGPELSVAFRQGLDVTGAGNHPAIWKGLAKMAAILTEGGHVAGNPPKAPADLGQTFFPNSKMT